MSDWDSYLLWLLTLACLFPSQVWMPRTRLLFPEWAWAEASLTLLILVPFVRLTDRACFFSHTLGMGGMGGMGGMM